MKKIYLAFFTLLMLTFPAIAFSSPIGTVGSIKISIDNVSISNQDIQGKIDFLPVISQKDVELKIGLGACWDGGNYSIGVDNKINNTKNTIAGTAPFLDNCTNWFSPPAIPASYTLIHNKVFNGQSVNFEYSGNPWPAEQQIEIRVYQDTNANQSQASLNNKFQGYIMLKTEDAGKAYYVSPVSKMAYYLAIPKISFQVMRGTGLGITNDNLEKIPVGDDCPIYMSDCDKQNKYDSSFADKYKGYIFLQVEENGEAWYIYPKDKKRYFLGTPENAFEIMKSKGWGINNSDFNKLELAYY
ncbi:MAG: hypothetical protein ABH830_03160 [Patescibacteria group bacterium]